MNHEHPNPGSTSRLSLPVGSSPATAEVDPVCHMTVEPATAAGSHVHAGKPYYFCSTHCLHKFRADPGRYLAPPTTTLEEGPNPELVDMSRRFRVGLALSLPIFVAAMGMMVAPHVFHPYQGILNWVQLILATPVVFYAGWPFFERAWASVVH